MLPLTMTLSIIHLPCLIRVVYVICALRRFVVAEADMFYSDVVLRPTRLVVLRVN